MESYSIWSEDASLSVEKDTENGRDGCLGQGEEKEGGLHSSAHLLLKGTHRGQHTYNTLNIKGLT